MISAAELAAMQAQQNLAMPGTVIIQRMTATTDGMGGYTETWAAVGTVTGRISAQSGVEIVTGGQPVSITRWIGTFPAGTSITAKDRVSYDSRTWEVMEVNNSQMWQTAVRVQLKALGEESRS